MAEVEPLVAASYFHLLSFLSTHLWMAMAGCPVSCTTTCWRNRDSCAKVCCCPFPVAMKRNEDAYLQALQSFSIPMREHWQVGWLGMRITRLTCWPINPCIAIGMPQNACFWAAYGTAGTEQDLYEETRFLQAFDRVYRAIDLRFDVRGKDLSVLVISALQNQGKVSSNRRRQFQNTVQPPVFDAIEELISDI